MILKDKYEGPVFGGYGNRYFVDEVGNEYRRILGGLAWPSGMNPGVIVILAES